MSSNDSLTQFLRSHKQSVTVPRRAVFNTLQGKEPLTMNELIAQCKSTIDRASTYRTVALFEKLGVIHRIQIGWKYKLELSDQFQEHHHHLTCSDCGQVVSVKESAQLEKQLAQLAEAADFVMHSHQLEIRGLCAACTSKT